MRMIYRGPFDKVTFPNTGQVVERGVPADVPDDAVLGADWLPADLDGMTVAELRDLADLAGVDVPGSAKKADLIAALADPTSSNPDDNTEEA